MEETLIAQKRSEYIPLGLGPKEYCIGNKSELSHFAEDGATIIPWNKTPDPNDFDKIKSLRLKPTEAQLKKAEFPSFVKNLSNLEFLEIPLPLILHLNQELLPTQIKTLMIVNGAGHVEMLKSERKAIEWPDIIMPFTKGLWLFDSSYSTQINSLLGINSSEFPSVEYVDFSVDKKGIAISALKEFKSLLFARINNVDVSETLRELVNPIKFLAINGAGNNFQINDITNLSSIEAIWLNTIKSHIDCEVFIKLPNLKEINVLNSKKITNTEALLKCRKLQNITFVNCNKPFRETKNKFLYDKYNIFDIKYS